MTNYILSDLISKINVAVKSHLISIKIPKSCYLLQILEILYKNGLLAGIKIENDVIDVLFKYYQNKSVFYSIKVISTPGNRIFWTLGMLSLVYGKDKFSGFYILSTSKGILTSNDCLLGQGIGGEVLLKICV